MKLYIWQGRGISDAYHDDGTLVVLAESPEQARAVARKSAAALRRDPALWLDLVEEAQERGDAWVDGVESRHPAVEWRPNPAIDRDPDRIVELTIPCVVAFNGGGYD